MLSDGAGAVYLSDRPNSDGLSLKIHWIDLLSYANEMPPCMYAGAEFRDGVFEGWKHADADYGRRHSLMAVKQDVKLLNENIVRYTVEKPLSQIAAKTRHPRRRNRLVSTPLLFRLLPRPPFRRPEKHRLRHSAGKMVYQSAQQRQHGFGLDLHHP